MYTQLAEIPVPTAAHFVNTASSDQHGSSVIQVAYTIRDHQQNVKRTVTKSLAISSEGSVVAAIPLQDLDIVAQVTSPSRKLRAVLRISKSGDSSPTRLVEIWNKDLLEVSANVTECHGDFYADEYLASLSFAPSESAILYTAEGKIPEAKDPFEKFRFNPDFGEGLVGKKRPVTFILRWDSSYQSTTNNSGKPKHTLVELKSGDVRFGQASFSPNSERIIYATGYESTVDGRMLGLKGCYNRPNGIWQLLLPEQLPEWSDKLNPAVVAVTSEKLTPASLSCRSPRIFSHNGSSTLLWLACTTGGAHVAASALYSLDVSSDSDTSRPLKYTDKCLVPILKDEIPSSPHVFPSLYPPYNLPSSPPVVELTSGPSIVIHSQWGSRTTVLLISTQDGKVTDLTPSSEEDELYSWTVLATDGRSRVICQRSSSSVPYEIFLGHFDDSGRVSWHLIDKPDLPEYIKKALSNIRTSIVPIPNRFPFETILIQPNNGKNTTTIPPLITYPHGGPHGTTSTSFSAMTTALVLEGYTISLPNYTGSLGYGDGFVHRLVIPGNCGKLDVEDCYASVLHLIESGIAEEGPGKQFVIGGSHGGFLVAHLIGQFPDMFSAAVLRNPVISAGAISSSDIPDWYFSEFGIEYPIASESPTTTTAEIDLTSILRIPPLISSERYTRLLAASPIFHVDSIKVPVLLLMGAADRRVAPSQGIEFYHALKARYASQSAANHDKYDGRKVEMLVFEGESHPLDGVEVAKVNFEVTKEWLADAGFRRK
ncbi:alpha/beta-hydrolase [Phlegmacium glaucopus]|nr:alpha/beta-hydrolase [Phlegmacium glaucopus]